ncbi:hypothetical protein TNCV_4477051 [Trichonephila clavipes]|nr:hypothetical protein TNCV_4477051 [Trichonephila clavipes]
MNTFGIYLDAACCYHNVQKAIDSPLIDSVPRRCNVTSPNINSSPLLCWTRHPHVHLATAAQPLFDPRGIEHRQPEDERRDALNLHGSGGQRILFSQNIGL